MSASALGRLIQPEREIFEFHVDHFQVISERIVALICWTLLKLTHCGHSFSLVVLLWSLQKYIYPITISIVIKQLIVEGGEITGGFCPSNYSKFLAIPSLFVV